MKPIARALALAALALLAACGKPPEQEAADPAAAAPAAALAVSLVPAEARDITRTVTASGAVAPWEEMQLGVELSGVRVTALHVDVGQAVRRGEVLLEVDHRTLDAELKQADAALAEARAGVALAQVNFARGDALIEKHLISARDLDELRAARVQAEARLATAQAQRDAAQLRRDFAELRAPDDGIVSMRLVQPGQVVASGSELLRLIRRGRLEWRAELPDAELVAVQPGVDVAIAALDGSKIEGVVRAVSPGVDAQRRTGTVYVDLPAPGSLKAGMFVEGRIAVGRARALMVPSQAVVRRDGYPYVFTVGKDAIAKARRIETGDAVGNRVEILAGIEPGAAVVARGAGFLADGDRVRVVAAPTPSAAANDAAAPRAEPAAVAQPAGAPR